MSKLGKLKRNARNYELKLIYENMTPEQYQEGIRTAVNTAINDLSVEYNKNIHKLKERYEMSIRDATFYAIDTLSVELLYELAKQMDCFNENSDYLEEKIDKVQEIYQNTMESIKKYTTYKTDNQARRKFEEKKKKVEKLFNIQFE